MAVAGVCVPSLGTAVSGFNERHRWHRLPEWRALLGTAACWGGGASQSHKVRSLSPLHACPLGGHTLAPGSEKVQPAGPSAHL